MNGFFIGFCLVLFAYGIATGSNYAQKRWGARGCTWTVIAAGTIALIIISIAMRP